MGFSSNYGVILWGIHVSLGRVQSLSYFDYIQEASKGLVSGWLVVSKIFYFHPYLRKIPILTNIFQMGWNHQLGGL